MMFGKNWIINIIIKSFLLFREASAKEGYKFHLANASPEPNVIIHLWNNTGTPTNVANYLMATIYDSWNSFIAQIFLIINNMFQAFVTKYLNQNLNRIIYKPRWLSCKLLACGVDRRCSLSTRIWYLSTCCQIKLKFTVQLIWKKEFWYRSERLYCYNFGSL